MPPSTCEECAVRPASAVVHRAGTRRLVCHACFGALWAGADVQLDLPRFVALLGRPAPDADRLSLPAMPPETKCPVCALRFGELAQHGMAGCPACYTAFAAALVPALRALNGMGGA